MKIRKVFFFLFALVFFLVTAGLTGCNKEEEKKDETPAIPASNIIEEAKDAGFYDENNQ